MLPETGICWPRFAGMTKMPTHGNDYRYGFRKLQIMHTEFWCCFNRQLHFLSSAVEDRQLLPQIKTNQHAMLRHQGQFSIALDNCSIASLRLLTGNQQISIICMCKSIFGRFWLADIKTVLIKLLGIIK